MRGEREPTSTTKRSLVRHLDLASTDTVADLWYGDAELARAVADQIPRGHLTLLTHDATTKAAADRALSGLHNVSVVLAAGADELPAGHFDAVYLAVRPYLSNAQRADLLSGARRCLRSGGRLLLLTHMRQGAPTILRRAEVTFGNVHVLDKPGGARIARCNVLAEVGDSRTPVERGHEERRVSVQLRGRSFTFITAPDVF